MAILYESGTKYPNRLVGFGLDCKSDLCLSISKLCRYPLIQEPSPSMDHQQRSSRQMPFLNTPAGDRVQERTDDGHGRQEVEDYTRMRSADGRRPVPRNYLRIDRSEPLADDHRPGPQNDLHTDRRERPPDDHRPGPRNELHTDRRERQPDDNSHLQRTDLRIDIPENW